jgi:DNA-binding MarR family transcriptional regulator
MARRARRWQEKNAGWTAKELDAGRTKDHPLRMDWTLTKTEWRILLALEEGRTVEQLATELDVDRTYTHKAVKGLVDRGLVAKLDPAPISYRATVRVRVEPNT